jgi:hypothetical protein
VRLQSYKWGTFCNVHRGHLSRPPVHALAFSPSLFLRQRGRRWRRCSSNPSQPRSTSCCFFIFVSRSIATRIRPVRRTHHRSIPPSRWLDDGQSLARRWVLASIKPRRRNESPIRSNQKVLIKIENLPDRKAGHIAIHVSSAGSYSMNR